MADQVSSSDLTSTSAVTWDEIPVFDVVEITPGGRSDQEFATLFNVQARMKGRALGEICAPITLTLASDAGIAAVVFAGAVPATAGQTNAPSNSAQILACGGVVLRANPTTGSSSATLTLLPGVSTLLKGATTTILSGAPPHLYFTCTAIKVSDGSAAPSTSAIRVIVSTRIRVSGVDWLRPF